MDTKKFTEKQQANIRRDNFRKHEASDWAMWMSRRHFDLDVITMGRLLREQMLRSE